jgi:3',5'-cyclic-AMP phosphodiesterase
MPIHVPPLSRRDFLFGSLATGVSLLTRRSLADFDAAVEVVVDPNRLALLSDTHIGTRLDQKLNGANTADRLAQAVADILAMTPRPAGLIIAGDCALLQGEAGDYTLLGKLLEPVAWAGIPVHVAMGNHDCRERFLAAFPKAVKHAAVAPAKLNKYVSIVETPQANWFLLDSLDKPNVTTGVLGEAQLTWLAQALDARPKKPALVLAHHNLDPEGTTHGLRDTAALLRVIEPRKQVKAYVYGHTHQWHLDRHGTIHLINLPAVACGHGPTEPHGFVMAQLRPDGMTLLPRLQPIDAKQPKSERKYDLRWRA